MTETIHIFDEFKIPTEDITNEIRHEKRVKLEPLVFNILRKKYGNFLQEAYTKTAPVYDSSNCILLVERRIHENLEFIFHNAAYFANGWSIAFVCSDVNLEYCKKIAEPWTDKIHFLPVFQGNPNRDQGRHEYNQLMKNPGFWNSLPWNAVWITQTDSYFISRIPPTILDFDFIAAVASWNLEQMVGGMSYRKTAAMKKICEEFKENIFSEDVFLNEGAKALDMRMPKMPDCVNYIWESVFVENSKPVGVHQWWTYLDLNDEFTESHFKNLLELDVHHTNCLES